MKRQYIPRASHMRDALDIIQQQLKGVDVILEVRDARVRFKIDR